MRKFWSILVSILFALSMTGLAFAQAPGSQAAKKKAAAEEKNAAAQEKKAAAEETAGKSEEKKAKKAESGKK